MQEFLSLPRKVQMGDFINGRFCTGYHCFYRQELSAVFTGLKTLDSVSTSRSADKLASKMGAKDSLDLIDHMTIDLASFYKTSFATKN